jgi:hypothetical protein
MESSESDGVWRRRALRATHDAETARMAAEKVRETSERMKAQQQYDCLLQYRNPLSRM